MCGKLMNNIYENNFFNNNGNGLFALKNISNNTDIFSYNNLKNIILYTRHSNTPNVNVTIDDRNSFFIFKTNKLIKKGEEVCINRNKIMVGGSNMYNIKSDISEELADFNKTIKIIMKFINNKDFDKEKIRELKRTINSTRFFQKKKYHK